MQFFVREKRLNRTKKRRRNGAEAEVDGRADRRGGEASIRLNRASRLRKASVGQLNLAVLLAATFVISAMVIT
jgi:hypothetical protein